MNLRPLGLLALLPLSFSVACGAGKAGEAVRPTDPTMADARGGGAVECHEVGEEGTPLIVDWAPEARGDLEVAMKSGVAVVHYDCNAIKVLSDCHVDGHYAYVGTTKKEQLITLENADQAQANLPLSGAKIGAGLARGSSLDIGLIMIGKTSTTSLGVDKSKLTGRCDGATHYVRSATVGAFAMKTSTSGEVKAAVDVFGVGASTSSSSAKTALNKDGDVAACQGADPDAQKAPGGCGALLRVQLLAVTATPVARSGPDSSPPREVSCAKGMVAAQGKCVSATTTLPHECDGADVNECAKQCDAGSAGSCVWAGMLFGLGVSGPADPVKSAKYDQRGCDLGDRSSCTSIGIDLLKGEGVPKDIPHGMTVLGNACGAGAAQACDLLGSAYTDDLARIGVHLPIDMAKGIKAFARACNLGNGFSCGKLGVVLADGKGGVPPDPELAKKLFRMACAAHDKASCARVAAH